MCVTREFVVGDIITKIPTSWRNFSTSLKHKRPEFSFVNLIDTLDMEEKPRVRDPHARVHEGNDIDVHEGNSFIVISNKME